MQPLIKLLLVNARGYKMGFQKIMLLNHSLMIVKSKLIYQKIWSENNF